MTLIDMIPEPTNVRDEFTVVIDQGVVDGNDASGMVTCIGGGSRDMIRSGNHMAMTPRDGNVYLKFCKSTEAGAIRSSNHLMEVCNAHMWGLGAYKVEGLWNDAVVTAPQRVFLKGYLLG